MKYISLMTAVCLLFLEFSSLAADTRPVVLMVGTRPEAVKMIPLYLALQKAKIPTIFCSTGQHAQMMEDVLPLFRVKFDHDFQIMKPNQDLFHISQEVLGKAKNLFEQLNPRMVVVQGDTTSAMMAALAAFYLKIPVGHVEAGLRTDNNYSPFPEEMNRRMISVIATLHFAPTPLAVSRLLEEDVSKESIFCTGNTVVDALYTVRNKIEKKELIPSPDIVKVITDKQKEGKKLLLLTAHRRESLNGGLKEIFTAIKKALLKHPDLFIIYPMHPNPKIKEVAKDVQLDEAENMLITAPLSYQNLVYILNAVDGVATDSGGVQEESVSLNKSVLILRNETDRPEGLKESEVELVGTDEAKIMAGIDRIMLKNKSSDNSKESVYGDGQSGARIAQHIQKFLNGSDDLCLLSQK